MDDYISREAAIEAAIDAADEWDGGSNPRREASIKTWLEGVPAADVVEVVRCKDCKHKHLENMVWTCPFGLPGGENFFCGYGAEPYKGEQECD